MAKTHYETLGVSRTAKQAEIKAAYRKLVLIHHPDRSKDPAAPQIFRSISEAFEILADPDERSRYDAGLETQRLRTEEFQARERRRRDEDARRLFDDQMSATATKARTQARRDSRGAVPSMLSKLSSMYARQQIGECEKLAREIIQMDPSQALPYAILGDISRSRGQLNEAARMYSFALQRQPDNTLYLQRYEEILDRAQMIEGRGRRIRIQPEEKKMFSVLTLVAVTLVACCYLILSEERPAFQSVAPIGSWTIGIAVMLFLSGVTAGASLSVGNLIDRMDAFSSRRMAPAVVLGAVALVSFPAACLLYFVLGAVQKAFNITTTRLLVGVGAITVAVAIASCFNPGGSAPYQVMLWGGNLVYLGAICGWTVADSLRR